MGCMNCRGHICENSDQIGFRDVGAQLGQRLSLDQLHGDVGAVISLPYLINPADTGMIKLGLISSLPEESNMPLRIGAKEQLHGHGPVEQWVPSKTYQTHPTPAKFGAKEEAVSPRAFWV